MSPNKKIPWDNRYEIGIETVDEQHKKLFDLVNKLYELEDGKDTKEELRTILYDFSEYMKVHFKDEEDYMSSIKFPLLFEHKQLHREIIDALAQIIHTPARLGIVKSKMRIVSKRVLVDHIMNEDSKIKLFLLEQENDEIFDISDL